MTLSSLLTVVNLMLCFRVDDIKSATVSSQLTKMKTAKMKKMQVVNLLFLPFKYNWGDIMDPILTKESYENKGIIETNYKKKNTNERKIRNLKVKM